MGGGFGSKFSPRPEGIIAAELARKAKAPVKLMLSRYEEQLCSGNRPSTAVKLKAAAKKDGTLVAIDCTTYGTGGVNAGAGFPFPYVYKVPNFRRQHSDVFINAGDGAAMRAPGHPPGCFLTESMMDDLAAKLGIDPLGFRRKNLDPDSHRTPIWQEQYTIGAREIGWHRRNKVPGAGNGAKKHGIGMASCMWGGGGGKGTQVQASIYSDGTVKVITGSQDLGTGTWTLVAIVAAEELGLRSQDITVKIGDSGPELPSGGSGGSTTAPSVSPAVKMAVDKARDELFQIVAPKLNVTSEELVAKDGKIYSKSDRTRALSWKEATALLGPDPITVQEGWAEGLSESDAAGVQFAEVEVDTETGAVKVLNMVAVQDCGLILNLLASESQTIGGMIQALSYALLEDRLMDVPTGIMLNPNMGDYKIAGTMEMPEMKPIMFDTDRKVTGLGEPPAIPGAGAIANAIYNAIGVRIHDLPITPDKILKALAEKE
jgi:xanthine dehydrogenase YagR molybdenum-binding subunit